MPELRWTLLILGAVFIAALAWWELRKPRQARRGDRELRSATPLSAPRDTDFETPTRVYREPTISLPDVRPRTLATTELPVIEVKDDSLIGLRIDGQTIEDDERDTPPIADEAILPSEREPMSPRESLLREKIDWPIDEDEHEVTWSDDPRPVEKAAVEKPKELRADPNEISADLDGSELQEAVEDISATSETRLLQIDIPENVQPRVEWPNDEERTILALRIVAPTDRFSGRALRQALMAEGFSLGKMDIFHKPGPDGRAIISAASLTRPGTFNLETIDTQRYTGLNLFSVLPGPLPGSETFEELLTTVRAMNERLRGGLQDDTGQPLTPTRIATIRSTLKDTAPLPASNTVAESAESLERDSITSVATASVEEKSPP